MYNVITLFKSLLAIYELHVQGQSQNGTGIIIPPLRLRPGARWTGQRWPRGLAPLNGTKRIDVVVFDPGFLELHDLSHPLLLATNHEGFRNKNPRAYSTQLIELIATSTKIFIVTCRQENRSNEFVWAEGQAKYQQLSFLLAGKRGVVIVVSQTTSCVVIICLDARTDTVEVVHQLCYWIIWNSN